jgi:pyridoxal phosphate enzyme (YggS family)
MISQRLAQVMERIERAARTGGRSPDAVQLVVVTKGHDLDHVQEAVEAGACRLGENYLDEALEKIEALKDHSGLQWHMIGHVQSRKARPVAEKFDYVHSVDSLKLAERLSQHALENRRILPVLLEINVSGEESKFGFAGWEEGHYPALLEGVRAMRALSNIEVRGLMSMAPYGSQPEAARPHFQRLRSLRERLSKDLADMHLVELSMGMSGDFEVAIQEGATLVRVGEAILGPRPAR